jgi:hypothetical protein
MGDELVASRRDAEAALPPLATAFARSLGQT